MDAEPAAAPKANGLATIVDTIVAPKDAFDRLRTAPTWVLAFTVALLLAVVGLAMLVPAIVHSTDASFAARAATDPSLAQMSPADLERARAVSDSVLKFTPLFAIVILPVSVLIQALVMLVLNATGKGSGTFKSFWAASANIAVPCFGLANLVAGIIAALRGPAAFDTPNAAQSIVPSMAFLAAPGTKSAYFLSAFNPFAIWAAILVGMVMLYTARTGKTPAWIAGALVLIVPGLFAMLAPATH